MCEGACACPWPAGENLPSAVVEAAFRYSLEQDVPLAAFLGDDCVTLRQTPELQVRCSRLRHGCLDMRMAFIPFASRLTEAAPFHPNQRFRAQG